MEEKILVIADRDDLKEQIERSLVDYKNIQYRSPREIKIEIDRIGPDVVLATPPLGGSGVDLVSDIRMETEHASIVFISDSEDFALLRDVIRAGAIEFFVFPDESALLSQRLEKIIQTVRLNPSTEVAATGQNFKRGRGRVFSFYSGKGGSGRSLLSSAFAQTLKFESTADVILIDLNMQFGGVDSYLGVESNRSFVELRPVINELNESHIRNVIEKERHSKLELLLSPKDAEIAETITDDFISKLIRACRRSYDFVIIDLPPTINEQTYTALEESDSIYYVIHADTPSLHILKSVESLFQRLNIDMEERVELVLNEVDKDNEIKQSDIKNLVRYPITAEIHRDYKGVQERINNGEPLRKGQKEKRLSPVAKDIRKWVLSKI